MTATKLRLLLATVMCLAACKHDAAVAPPAVDAAPRVEKRAVSVRLTLPSARSAEEIEGRAIIPAEKALTAAGAERIMSYGMAGAALLAMTLPADVDAARVLQGAGLPEGTGVELVGRGHAHLRLDAQSETLDALQVRAILEAQVVPKLAEIAGVSDVHICGIGRPALTVRLDTRALAGTGLAVADVRAALAKATPAGVEDVSHTVIATANGASIRIADVATVELGPRHNDCWVVAGDGKPRLEVEVTLADERAEKAATDAVNRLRPGLPAAVHLAMRGNPTVSTAIMSLTSDEEMIRVLKQAASTFTDVPGAMLRVDHSPAVLPRSPETVELTYGEVSPAVRQKILSSWGLVGMHPEGGAALELAVSATDPGARVLGAQALMAAARSIPSIDLAGVEGNAAAPVLDVTPDADALSHAGVTLDEVDEVLALARDGVTVGHATDGTDVVLAVGAARGTLDPDLARDLRVGKAAVPLSALVKLTMKNAPLTVRRFKGAPVMIAWFHPKSGQVTNAWIAEVTTEMRKVVMPEGTRVDVWTR